jgi:hypothetical protein
MLSSIFPVCRKRAARSATDGPISDGSADVTDLAGCVSGVAGGIAGGPDDVTGASPPKTSTTTYGLRNLDSPRKESKGFRAFFHGQDPKLSFILTGFLEGNRKRRSSY